MLKGIDVSMWQPAGTVDFSPYDFVIVKATEGIGYTDPCCEANYQKAKAEGKLRGVYHFARPVEGNDPVVEADWFVNETIGYQHDAILVLDWEAENQWNVAWAKTWLDRVYERTGVKPMIYMSATVIASYDWSSVANADYGLWIAGYPYEYDVPNPPTPTPEDMPFGTGAWPFWAIWQYSSCCSALDKDIAQMDAHAWNLYAGVETAPEPIPEPTPEPTPEPEPEPQPTPTPEPEPIPEEPIKVGDKVEPIPDEDGNYYDYCGNQLVRYDDVYDVAEIMGNRVVLTAPRGEDNEIWCAMDINKLRKV